jgi:predicted  nucleic acid-binding Zn-ribbon protein
MAIEETLKSAERTLKEAQQLMSKIQKQNEVWPGAGAFQKDITTAKTLLNQMQQSLSDIFVEFTLDQDEHPDSDREMKVSRDFSEAYSLMNKLYDAVRKVDARWGEALGQSDTLIESEKYLKQLINHCLTARDHLSEISHDLRFDPSEDDLGREKEFYQSKQN